MKSLERLIKSKTIMLNLIFPGSWNTGDVLGEVMILNVENESVKIVEEKSLRAPGEHKMVYTQISNKNKTNKKQTNNVMQPTLLGVYRFRFYKSGRSDYVYFLYCCRARILNLESVGEL